MLDRRFFFDTIKMNYECLECEEEFLTIFKASAVTTRVPTLVKQNISSLVNLAQ